MKEKAKEPVKAGYQIYMDKELLKKAQAKAKSEDMRLTQVIRRFLMDYVSNPQGKLF